MRRTAIALTSAIMGAGVMFGFVATVTTATAQPPNDVDTSVVSTTAEVPNELVIVEPAQETTDVVTTPEPTRTPVEVKISTEPVTPPTGGVMRQEDFPCQEDEVLGYHPRFGDQYVGCIHINEFPVTW